MFLSRQVLLVFRLASIRTSVFGALVLVPTISALSQTAAVQSHVSANSLELPDEPRPHRSADAVAPQPIRPNTLAYQNAVLMTSMRLPAETSAWPEEFDSKQQNSTASTSTELQNAARLQGTVVDVQGQPVPDAKISLLGRGKFDERTSITGSDGAFQFSGLPAEQYRVAIVAAGFEATLSQEFVLRVGQTLSAPPITLKISTAATSITVTADREQIAEAQVEGQEKQRVFGVFPNFYTSYIWKAEPMPKRLKYRLAFRALVDPFTILVVAGTASAEHYNGTYPGYGPGIAGYGKRFGAAYGDALTSRVIGSAILPSVLHQDPRYFYQGSGSVASRSTHALASTFVTRGDSGKTQINFSHLLGSLAAGAIANAYHPSSSRGLGLTFETFGITTGANAIGNLFREFVLKGLEPSIPVFANGRH